MATRSVNIGVLCALYVVFCSMQVALAVKCLVCPGNKLANCIPTDDFNAKVTYEETNCTACGKLFSSNPKPPTQQKYVGLRNTVRNLEYKYCATQDWTGCKKYESAVTTSIECVCRTDGCNGAGRLTTVSTVALTASLMMAAWALNV